MKIGIPKEIKDNEFRVSLTPNAVATLVANKHEVVVQKDAGKENGFFDEMYKKSGAQIVNSLEEVYQSEMVIKVKEPQKKEIPLLKEKQILFCYLHLAADRELTQELIKKKIIGIAFETVTDDNNNLPLLIPMSMAAGKIAISKGASLLQKSNAGKGVILGGLPGVRKAHVVVIGGGIVGEYALKEALAMGADVEVFDINVNRLKELDTLYGPYLKTIYFSEESLKESLKKADLIIGAVLIKGAKAPRIITRDMLKLIERKSVIIDVSIDQGGCVETSKPTTHANPTYEIEGVIHYCVANIPGDCPKTTSSALSNAISPYSVKIANLGYKKSILEDKHLRNGLNLFLGNVTNKEVARDLKFEYKDIESII
ncbi:MAG: alanine dehydrogenase [Chlamydiae bacterium SM23_39]|nr:MAG: alanine dehydrogenase [Chlamydiae bacterium SM23_39]